ncbi:retrotransposon unclassified [Nannochloropsis gaditana]|uniref:Retrotransposon unclassified n=1 Tax=Nannochloropsis gaditana TaxID=72520 RepID=W7TWC6_9STRA|nr:retrotransposon unclassified [Nannochloropsis gaditana]
METNWAGMSVYLATPTMAPAKAGALVTDGEMEAVEAVMDMVGAKEPLELVHTDVLGPVEVESLGGARYAIGFTDDYTRWRVVYPMKHKSESLDCLKRYIQDMNISFRDHKVNTLRGLRSDNGGEYTGIDFKNFCKNHGIRQDFGRIGKEFLG